MKNTLNDLNNALFEALERIQDCDLNEEQLDTEIKRSQAVTKVAEVIVRNGELGLKAMQHMNDMGYGSGQERDQRYLAPVPQLLDSGKKEKE